VKRGWRDFGFTVIGIILGGLIGIYSGVLVEKYSIREHERIKAEEKVILKQKIERENKILISRLEEDFQAFKDSVTAVFVGEKKQDVLDHGLMSPGSNGLRAAMEARFDAERNGIIAAKRKDIDRKIEDLKMRLDF
jgi:hypothetical protein